MAQATAIETEARADGREPRARLLVVEDDARRRRALELLLAGRWTIEVAGDGREALEKARRRAPDLVLADLALPVGGLDLIHELRAATETRTVPIVVVTGLTDEAVRLAALEAGADDFLIKPFSERELSVRLSGLLEMARLRREATESDRRLEEVRQVGRSKDEFVALLSHELRTPLSAIVGWAHMLRTADLDESTRARAVETIDRNAKLQNQLIEDILDVSRIVAGKFHVEMRPMDLARAVEAARDAVAPLAAAKKVALDLQVDAPLPPTVGDPDRLQQVAWNLLSNAVKFTPSGGKVEASLARRGDAFELEVRDSGAGIDPDFLPHVFERFRQGNPPGAKRQGGLGLGLSIVRHVVEVHGGTVEAHSDGPGRGAAFLVRLPANDAGTGKVAPVGRGQAEGMGEAPRLDGLRVLLVDDEADARELIAAVLQDRGAHVLPAASAAEAARILSAERPDVVLSDISMRDEDGYDFIRKVRALPPAEGGRTPAAALTAYGRLEDRMKALSAGFQLHVAKPVDPAELVAVVATLGRRA